VVTGLIRQFIPKARETSGACNNNLCFLYELNNLLGTVAICDFLYQ